mgnify:FL=1
MRRTLPPTSESLSSPSMAMQRNFCFCLADSVCKYASANTAMSANLDVRTARSVLEGSCGVRGFDALASAYGWDFIESVMTPVVGDDPIAALEKEIENEKRGIAAREARLERLRACVEDRGRLRSVAAKERPSSVWLG